MEVWPEPSSRVWRGPLAGQPFFCLGRRRGGNDHRILPGIGPLGAMRDPPFFHPIYGCYNGDDLFRRHLLRRHVRRVHDIHPAPNSR